MIVTTAEINSRLAKGECANFHNGGCESGTVCHILSQRPCRYFNQYVLPLLDQDEFSDKYAREARNSKLDKTVQKKPKVIPKPLTKMKAGRKIQPLAQQQIQSLTLRSAQIFE